MRSLLCLSRLQAERRVPRLSGVHGPQQGEEDLGQGLSLPQTPLGREQMGKHSPMIGEQTALFVRLFHATLSKVLIHFAYACALIMMVSGSFFVPSLVDSSMKIIIFILSSGVGEHENNVLRLRSIHRQSKMKNHKRYFTRSETIGTKL